MNLHTLISGVTCLVGVALVSDPLLCRTAQAGINTVGAIVVTANTATPQLLDRVRYNPSVIYSGSHGINVIYYHNSRNPVWRVGINKDLNNLTCRFAQDSLRRTGLWMGHLLPDGSCGDTAEPVEWAVGNWMNFNAARSK